jgi:membrane fusion protein, multidrug efflux system
MISSWWLILVLAKSVLSEPIALQAALEAAHSTRVFSYQSGIVRQVVVQVGDLVAAGDTLALLADETLQLEERGARLAVDKAQSRLVRVQQLHANGGVSTQDLETLAFEVQAAELFWQKARMELAQAILIAPTCGIVAEVHTQEGERISAGRSLLLLIKPRDLKAEFFLAVDQLEVLQHDPVVATGTNGKQVEGRITLISPLIDTASGTCRVVAEFPNAGQVFRPGMVVSIALNGE